MNRSGQFFSAAIDPSAWLGSPAILLYLVATLLVGIGFVQALDASKPILGFAGITVGLVSGFSIFMTQDYLRVAESFPAASQFPYVTLPMLVALCAIVLLVLSLSVESQDHRYMNRLLLGASIMLATHASVMMVPIPLWLAVTTMVLGTGALLSARFRVDLIGRPVAA